MVGMVDKKLRGERERLCLRGGIMPLNLAWQERRFLAFAETHKGAVNRFGGDTNHQARTALMVAGEIQPFIRTCAAGVDHPLNDARAATNSCGGFLFRESQGR